MKDPVKRRQYDLIRKYEKTDTLLEKVTAISPDNPSIMMAMMVTAIPKGDFDELKVLFNKALGTIPESEITERAAMYTMKASMLLSYEYTNEAIVTLDEGKKLYPEETQAFE